MSGPRPQQRRPSQKRRPSQQRRKAEQAGRWAEAVAALLLRLKGYRIIGQRQRGPLGEIDIIARRGRVLALVEVKQRASRTAALEAVSPRQQARIARAAALLEVRHPEFASLDRRFDVVLVTPWRLPVHVMDAWR